MTIQELVGVRFTNLPLDKVSNTRPQQVKTLRYIERLHTVKLASKDS